VFPIQKYTGFTILTGKLSVNLFFSFLEVRDEQYEPLPNNSDEERHKHVYGVKGTDLYLDITAQGVKGSHSTDQNPCKCLKLGYVFMGFLNMYYYGNNCYNAFLSPKSKKKKR